MKKTGFTLTELLAVIVLLALLMVIVVPNALKLSSRVKDSGYNTKIELMESAAINWGMDNTSLIKENTTSACTFTYNQNGELTNVNYLKNADTVDNSKNEYWCTQVKIKDLVLSGDLTWDEENVCKDDCSEEEKSHYNNIVINPKSEYVINYCNMYVYYKNNRIYATFDSKTCSIQSDTPNIDSGREYKPKMPSTD